MPIAMITGATSGIGLGFSLKLAEEKYDLFLVSRSKEKLEDLKNKIENQYKVRVLVRVCDLSQIDQVDELCREVEKLNIDLFVNNAGIGLAQEFANSARSKNSEMMNLNMYSVTQLCQAVAQVMKSKNAGQIINVASMAGFQAGPYMAVYYATKAYVISLSEALHEELKPYGISVTALCPGPVETGFQKAASYVEQKSFLHLSIDRVVSSGLVGVRHGQPIIVPGLINSILIQLNRILPRSLMRKIMKKRLAVRAATKL